MLYIYIKHIVFKENALALYHTISNMGYCCQLVDIIDSNSDNYYLILGGHNYLDQFPKNYIIYQLEQTNILVIDDDGNKKEKLFSNRYILTLMNAKQVWDYSLSNIKYLKKHYKLTNLYHLPIYYTPYLDTMKYHMDERPIDILFYGSINSRREKILKELEKKYKVGIYVNNLWDKDRDDMIKKSKIVVNIHYYDNAILELHRISYLLSNKCLVISEIGRDSNDLDRIAILVHYSNLIKECDKWLSKTDEERKQMAIYSYQQFKSQYLFSNYVNKLNLDGILEKTEHKNSNSKNSKKKKTKLDYYIPSKIELAETIKDTNDNFILKLPSIDDNDLPFVSILTPTGNRRKLFSIAIRNFLSFTYPKDKLEWIIVDDGKEDLKDMLPYNDNRIKYIKIETRDNNRLPMGEKRNLCVEYSSNHILVNMDDDDYYPPESILARVKTLIKYPTKKCVGCSEIGCYNLLNNISSIASDGIHTFTEASMAFKKDFWIERKFNNNNITGEGKYFLQYRENELINIPFQFVIIAINHGNNTTNHLRDVIHFENWYKKNKENYYNFIDYLDEDTQIFLLELTKLIKNNNITRYYNK